MDKNYINLLVPQFAFRQCELHNNNALVSFVEPSQKSCSAITCENIQNEFVTMLLVLQGKTEEQIKAEKAWYNTEKVWLVHKDGFSMGENKLLYPNLCIKGLFLDICKVNSQLSILSVMLCLFLGDSFSDCSNTAALKAEKILLMPILRGRAPA